MFREGHAKHWGTIVISSKLKRHRYIIPENKDCGSIRQFNQMTLTHGFLLCVELQDEKLYLKSAILWEITFVNYLYEQHQLFNWEHLFQLLIRGFLSYTQPIA